MLHTHAPILVHLLPSFLVCKCKIEAVHHTQKSGQNPLAYGFGEDALSVFLLLLEIGKIRSLFLPAGQVLFLFFLFTPFL